MGKIRAGLWLALPLLASCTTPQGGPGAGSEWPVLRAPTAPSPATEDRIARIVAGMTLEQKIGQITQPDIRYVTPDEIRRYYIGSVLNGGGAWPGMRKDAAVGEWVKLSDAYYRASMTTDMPVRIPVIWGTDAVHGHSNVAGATLFPHNIGLGAAHDPALVERIGRATARQVRATGISWVFAPTLAVGENRRWGRTYESYSSDPTLVARYATALVNGLQGGLAGDGDVIATAKHFLGDGGTFDGVDQGEARATRAEMIRRHGAGYYAALGAGVQTVMVSYSSWNDVAAAKDYGKMHGNRELLTDVLKGRLGFDGLIVSDWNGIAQVPGCTRDHCPQAINAGIDMVMVPEDWKAFIANTIADVREGRIAVARIDDAVTRILRVKLRTGLFDRPPSASAYAGREAALDDTALAREAVRKSVVLLKNDGRALPLARGKRVLVVGASADSLSNQTGGWSLTWQGTENSNRDFRTGTTLVAALRQALGDANVAYSVDGKGVDPARFAAVVAVLGEPPYAEYQGDVRFPKPLQHSALNPADLAVLQAVSGKGAPVISVLYSGRPAYANDLINLSDAFVAAFLPGTEAQGIADLLIGQYDFSARLSFAWPGSACSTGEGPAQMVQFARGYGLRYARPAKLGPLPLPTTPAACDTGAR